MMAARRPISTAFATRLGRDKATGRATSPPPVEGLTWIAPLGGRGTGEVGDIGRIGVHASLPVSVWVESVVAAPVERDDAVALDRKYSIWLSQPSADSGHPWWKTMGVADLAPQSL